ncbi:MAG: hypothetical protein WAO10_10895 [Candidatus Sulfotelmatobacter sp.]
MHQRTNVQVRVKCFPIFIAFSLLASEPDPRNLLSPNALPGNEFAALSAELCKSLPALGLLEPFPAKV